MALAATLVGLGLVCAAFAWPRWALSERAIRRSEPLPHLGFAGVSVVGGLIAVGVIVALALSGLPGR